MKTLIGVDLEGDYCPALDLCERLAFPDQLLIFAHVVQTPGFIMSGLAPNALVESRVMEGVFSAGEAAANKAAALFPERPSKIEVVTGDAGRELLRLADSHHVDLIAIGSAGKHGLASYFGSVGRALAMASKRSFLIGKGKLRPASQLTAIFATDHSPYANKCLKRLCRWKPAGLEKVHVVSAFDMGNRSAQQLWATVGVEVNVEEAVNSELSRLGQTVAEQLRTAGYESDVHVYPGHPTAVLPEAMKSLKADLLLMGAHGLGFLEDLLIGSLTLHQISRESYPVLVIRA